MSITVGWKNLEHTATELQDWDIERTATEVEYGDLHILVGLIDTVGQGCCGRLVHDTANIKACNLSGFLGCLTLRVWEVCRHCDYGVRNFLTQIVLCGLLHLLKYHGRDFLRSIFTSFDVDTWITTFVNNAERNTLCLFLALCVSLTHETFYRVNGVLRVGDCLTLCRVAHLALTVFYESYNWRSGTLAFAVCYYYRFVAFKYGNARVCST